MGRAFGNTAAQIRSVTPRLPNRRQRIVKETAMLRAATPERLSAFSDGVFAVLITVLVLDLRPPELPAFKALLSRWPTWLSYAVSYLFVAIVWVNHHHLLRCAEMATPRLIWVNFAHLFAVSFVPFSTAWIADSRLAPFPVALYAGDFVLVNATYIALRWAVANQLRGIDLQIEMARLMKVRA